jgi:hypothetical protein
MTAIMNGSIETSMDKIIIQVDRTTGGCDTTPTICMSYEVGIVSPAEAGKRNGTIATDIAKQRNGWT